MKQTILHISTLLCHLKNLVITYLIWEILLISRKFDLVHGPNWPRTPENSDPASEISVL